MFPLRMLDRAVKVEHFLEFFGMDISSSNFLSLLSTDSLESPVPSLDTVSVLNPEPCGADPDSAGRGDLSLDSLHSHVGSFATNAQDQRQVRPAPKNTAIPGMSTALKYSPCKV